MPRVDCFLLADAVQVANGKLFILGGGWARLTVDGLPVNRPFEIAVRVVVPWTETNRKLPFELQMIDEDGNGILEQVLRADISVGRPVQLKEGTDQVVPLTLRLPNVRLEKEGRYALTLSFEGTELARTAFDLVVKAPPARG
ncbi:MAG: hypothetical protein KF883_11535 [Thermomicrobiales bacterium]|nr:hypothetical protein [Thermomicrobiales bacterium]